MRKSSTFLALVLLLQIISFSSFAQSVIVTGTVTSSQGSEAIPAVSILVKGSSQGGFTDDRGNFKITVPRLPVTLLVSSIGYASKEVSVSGSGNVSITLDPAMQLGEDVVIAATRTPVRLLESPVSIERVTTATIRNAAAPSYYDILQNLKGVDVTTSSFSFKTPSTRGFNGSGNLRFNQLVDGMDNQAPALNFSVGSIIGLTELDVESMELLPGASSALYGSGGTNGTLLINSKSPFKYQGLSFQIKQGANHVDRAQRSIAPYYDWSLRWAKTIGEKFAFKIGGQFIQVQDWRGTDERNLLRNNVISSLKDGDRNTDPNYDGVNVFGDEASASMFYIAQAGIFGPSNPSLTGVATSLGQALGRAPTQLEILNFYSTTTNPQFGPLRVLARGITQGYYGNQLVSRTGYAEKSLVDYNSYNVRLSAGLNYKITNDIEASFLGYFGTGTSVYTGADRYSLKNLKMGQYKLELKSSKWFLRGYTTQENSGDSYTATTAALFVNNAWKANATWFGEYSGNYSGARDAGASAAQAHAIARSKADSGRFLPGSAAFQQAFNNAINTNISAGGAKFADRSNLYHLEGQYNLSDYVKFAEVLVGASYRNYLLNSQGTIFADTAGKIGISEVGGYLQVQKKLANDVLKLSGSIRYDKNENFEGRFTPRLGAVIKVAQDNNIRISFQTAYRFPSTQDQYINLLTGGANRLIGGLPSFGEFFKFSQNPAYTSQSIVDFRTTNDPGKLKVATFTTIKPETTQSYEIGYKGLVTKKLLLDVYTYYSSYKDFIARAAVGRGQSADPNTAKAMLASPFTTNNYSFVVNSPEPVKAIGFGAGIDYNLYTNYFLSVNATSDRLSDVPSDLITFFNTPKYRFNVGLGNSNVVGNWGFNVMYRWQDKVNWQGTFGSGEVPSYGVLDAMISRKIVSSKSLLKFGATNLFNKYYRSAFGNPQVGGLFYVSFAYNVF
jgi:outer membrane receptor protein involved in Fe transport